jgi:hypothetical protein
MSKVDYCKFCGCSMLIHYYKSTPEKYDYSAYKKYCTNDWCKGRDNRFKKELK